MSRSASWCVRSRCLLASMLGGVLAAQVSPPVQDALPPVPRIDGAWWQIAGNPPLGALGTPQQQPVDFTIWQAADGTWQLCSCIRNTAVGGGTRLLHRWQAANLTDVNWQPMGVLLQADPRLGELLGGLQAPHVFRANGLYQMVYGDGQRICLASSVDGKQFTRSVNANGQPDLFAGPLFNSRDPMVLRIGALWHCYYCGSLPGAQYQCVVFCRTSADLLEWSEPTVVNAGGAASQPSSPFDAECPFVVERGGWYCLFRNQLYGANAQNTWYVARNPLAFGVGDDRHRVGTLPIAAPEIVLHQGQYYVAALMPGLDGVRMARLRFVEQ